MTNEQSHIKKLYELLKSSINKLPKEKLAMAFSGGVDSSTIAKIMKDSGFDFTCYVVGAKGGSDLKATEKPAKEINLKLKKIILTKEEIEKALPTQAKILQKLYKKNKTCILEPNAVSVSFNLPLLFVAKYAKEKCIIVCHGPDDLLLGSIAYLKINKEDRIKESEKAIKLFFKTDFLQNKSTAQYFRKKFLMPYLNEKIIRFCLSIPYELKIHGKTRKYILRVLAEKLGLGKETAFRERKAAQYGSGIMKIMKKIAKEKGMKINEYISKLSNQ